MLTCPRCLLARAALPARSAIGTAPCAISTRSRKSPGRGRCGFIYAIWRWSGRGWRWQGARRLRRSTGLLDDSPPKPEPPDPAERDRLLAEAAEQLRIAADYIATCGYHRRDEELAELHQVVRGERNFAASLPPRV